MEVVVMTGLHLPNNVDDLVFLVFAHVSMLSCTAGASLFFTLLRSTDSSIRQTILFLHAVSADPTFGHFCCLE